MAWSMAISQRDRRDHVPHHRRAAHQRHHRGDSARDPGTRHQRHEGVGATTQVIWGEGRSAVERVWLVELPQRSDRRRRHRPLEPGQGKVEDLAGAGRPRELFRRHVHGDGRRAVPPVDSTCGRSPTHCRTIRSASSSATPWTRSARRTIESASQRALRSGGSTFATAGLTNIGRAALAAPRSIG
jgi:hypothetical protein